MARDCFASLPRLKYCCCCCNLRIGTLVYGIFLLITTTLLIMVLVWLNEIQNDFDKINKEDQDEVRQLLMEVNIEVAILYVIPGLICGTLLVIGATKKSSRALKAFVVISAIFCVVDFIYNVIGEPRQVRFFILLGAALVVYLILCVNSYAQEIEDENELPRHNTQPHTP